MGAGLLEKIRKMKERTPERGNFPSFKGVFHQWKESDNIIRLVGDFLEVKTHFVSPNPKRGERGLCQAKAFQGNNRIPQTVNCLDWDIEKEEARPKKVCPFCMLNNIARLALKESPTPDEKKFFENLKQIAYARTALKWHLIDRDDPFVLRVENGNEIKVKGLKIGTVGTEAWKDIEGIFTQCGFDISDPEEGIDICVTKVSAAKTAYSAKAVLEGRPPTVKITPLTDEEKGWALYDLKAICGKQVDIDMLMDALHGDLRELLDLNTDEAGKEPAQEPPPAPPPPPTRSSAAPARRAPPPPPVEEPADEDAGSGDPLDDDGGLGPVKKK
jgi:hypothetical protein